MNIRRECFVCKNIVDKDTLALNKKLLGRQIDKFFCIECLADFLDTTTDVLRERIIEFKEQGCTLF